MVAASVPCSRWGDLYTSSDKTLTISLQVVTTAFLFLKAYFTVDLDRPPNLSESAISGFKLRPQILEARLFLIRLSL